MTESGPGCSSACGVAIDIWVYVGARALHTTRGPGRP